MVHAPVVIRSNATSSPCALQLSAPVSLVDHKCPAPEQQGVCELISAPSESPADHVEKRTKSLISGRASE